MSGLSSLILPPDLQRLHEINQDCEVKYENAQRVKYQTQQDWSVHNFDKLKINQIILKIKEKADSFT